MSKRVLVGYSTDTGTTPGVAEAIGETLAGRGFEVDVVQLKDAPSLAGYDAAVLGSAINGGRWLPEAAGYVEAHAPELAELPCAVFCVHAMNSGEGEKKRRKREAYLDPVRSSIAPMAEGFFAGKGPTEADTSAFTRWMFRAFGGDVEGDGRDWDAIRGWADQLEL
jgi:menaquinone-dependent protoporphyrinogen oxidase